MITLYATHKQGEHQYPVVKLEFNKGDFKHRKQTIIEMLPTFNKAMLRCGELNGCK